MAANTAPIFTLTPVAGCARIVTANTNRDGSGTLYTLVTAGANGTRLDTVTIQASGTTTAGMIRLYIDDLSGTIKLVKEISVTAITPSGTVQSFAFEWVRADVLPLLVLPSGFILKCSTNNAEQFDVVAHGGHF